MSRHSGAAAGAGVSCRVSAAGIPTATRVVSRDGVPESKPEMKGAAEAQALVGEVRSARGELAPLALPTMFTAATLVGTGVSKSWVML